MTGEGQAAVVSELKDRKTGLVIFGILQIVLAAFCALALAGMAVAMLATLPQRSDEMALNLRMMVPGLLFYALLGAWFLTMGIGSIRARRWARALILITGWFWLICGALGIVLVAILGGAVLGRSGGRPGGPEIFIMLFLLGFMSIIYVAIPTALILFYRSPHVKATCEQRNPQPCWTDRVPLPVLAMTLLFGLGAPAMLTTAFYNWTVPFFGNILSGWAGAALILLSALLWAYVAWGSYRLRMGAWWCALLASLLWTISGLVTFVTVGMAGFQERMYEGMNLPQQQLDVMRQTAERMQPVMPVLIAVWAVVIVVYLLYVRRYFIASQEQPAS